MKFNTSKELFDFIRTTDTSDFPSLKKILEKYDSPRVTVNDILSELKDKNENIYWTQDSVKVWKRFENNWETIAEIKLGEGGRK